MQERHHTAGTVRHDDDDAASRAKANGVGSEKAAKPIEQDGARRGIVDIDALTYAFGGGSMIDFECAAPDPQGCVSA